MTDWLKLLLRKVLSFIITLIGGGLSSLIVKKPTQNYRNAYIGYAKTKDEGEI
jgi:hypothetical protein